MNENASSSNLAAASNIPPAAGLSKKDFQSRQEVRWCPGCGDYAILNGVQTVFAKLGVPREQLVVVSGIGCSSRLPYYVNSYGFHGIHGRAPGIATGLKLSRPELSVWVVTGDGDALSIGGNHLIHALRRNVGLKILLFDNRIYGLTKGQYSPTSEQGQKTASTPLGSVEGPFNPVALALGAGATFVARTVDIYTVHLQEMLERAAHHRGAALVHIYQNCNIFNNKAFAYMTEKEVRDDQQIVLHQGAPLRFGKEMEKAIRRAEDGHLEIIALRPGETRSDLVIHDESREDPSLAFELSQLGPPRFPTPIGVFRDVDRPSYEEGVQGQITQARARHPASSLDDLLRRGEVWTVE
ncbi:MAG: 2-oxoacid:ferredoxin oxidoreductase subunit beta [Planctomycetota bacterium]